MNLVKFYTNSFLQDMTAFGTLYHFAVLLTVLISFGQYDLVYRLVAGQIALYAVSIPAKLLFFRDRPARMKHSNFIEKIEASSFPSVHTTRIFLVSYVLISYFSVLTVLLSLISVSVAYSRIYLKRHYYTDVLAGALLGIALGYGVVNYV